MRGNRLAPLGALVVALAATVSCGETSAVEGSAREARVVEQVVRAVMESEPTEPDVTPVAYVVGSERAISIDVQAAVAASLVDEIDVRFADGRAEALDEGLDDVPVRDGGVLLVIGKIPEEGRQIDVLTERYRSAVDTDNVVVSLRWREPEWTVTSTTVLPPLIE